jgi:enoyl-CoA hydratase
LNRPERLNALSAQLARELDALLDEIAKDDEARVIIITGAPRPDGRPCFCAGADLKEAAEGRGVTELLAASLLDRVEGFMTERGVGIPIFDKLINMGKPSIAAIDGVCTAGGIELAMSCDMRTCSETARVSDMHIKNLGIIGGAGACTKLARIVGPAKAMELVFTGDPIDGNEAWRIGFAIRVFPPDKLIEGTKELAKKIAGMRPDAIRVGKAVIRAAADMPLREALRYDLLALASLPPPTEAIEAFAKR